MTILRLAKERDELKVVDDQFGAPTWARTIAEFTAQILGHWYSSTTNHDSRITSDASRFTNMSGIYNVTASGETTWYGFAKALLQYATLITHHRSPFSDVDSRITDHASRLTFDASGMSGANAPIIGVDSPFTHNRLLNLVPIPTEAYSASTRRPRNSRLDNSKLFNAFGFVPPGWDMTLKECIREMADD